MNENVCPVCGYELGFRPWDDFGPSDQICPSCGTQFGYHDSRKNRDERTERYKELRRKWIENGKQWHSRVEAKPKDWNPEAQLASISGKKKAHRAE